MPIIIDNTEVEDITINNTEVDEVTIDGEVVWESSKIPDDNGYIYNKGEHEDEWVEGYKDDDDIILSKEEDHLLIDNLLGEYEEGIWVTKEKIDLTDYNYLYFKFDNIGGQEETRDYSIEDLSGEFYFKAIAFSEIHYLPHAFIHFGYAFSVNQQTDKDDYEKRDTDRPHDANAYPHDEYIGTRFIYARLTKEEI